MAEISLLVDENISWRIKKLLPHWQILPVNEIKTIHRLSDKSIWEYAKLNNYTILTFDEDFVDLLNLYSYPPKIIWLRSGNTGTLNIAQRLLDSEATIVKFMADTESGILEIY